MTVPLVVRAQVLVLTVLSSATLGRAAEPDARFLVHVNVRQVLDSTLFRRHFGAPVRTALEGRNELWHLLSRSGLDPWKDVSSLTVTGPSILSHSQDVLTIQGPLDPVRIDQALAARARKGGAVFSRTRSGGATLFDLNADGGASGLVVAVTDDGNVLLASRSRSRVQAALTRRAGKDRWDRPGELESVLEGLDRTQTLWLAALPTQDLRSELAANEFLKPNADKLHFLRGGIRVTDAIQVDVRIRTTDARSAREIRHLVDGIKAVVAVGVLTNDHLEGFGPVLADLLNRLKVTNRQNEVLLQGTITADQIEAAIQKGKSKP
jgi:hypothetical protein